jgi:hypothetical protein
VKKGIDDDERPKLRPFPERREGLARAENPPSSEEMFNSAQAEVLQLVKVVVRGDDPVYVSARDELVATVKKRTGQSLTFRVLDRITNSLESRGVTMPDFVAAVRTQNLEALRSVPAFLTDFARGFLSANKTVIPEVLKPEDMPRICELGICGGHGHENLTKGVEITFCKCSIGQELRTKWQRAEERRATAVASRPCQPEAGPASGTEIRNRSGAASAR